MRTISASEAIAKYYPSNLKLLSINMAAMLTILMVNKFLSFVYMVNYFLLC